MLLLLAFAVGMFAGWRRAAGRGGDRRDRLQYGVAYGIAFTLVALALSILAGRLGLV